ncbi:MAG: histidine ammonia-lyase [Candidatus Cloacimonetes bacterium]|nr:histidine ammonia-lyase [Candidatus Cloacimonadota bacterium]
MSDQILIDGNSLTLDQIHEVAINFKKIAMTEEAKKNVNKCRAYVDKIVSENRIVYGITTGFGKFANIVIDTKDIEELQENLILSHATGVGSFLPINEVRAIQLLRINVLAKGHSGIRLSTLETLIDMLNAEIHPCIPEKGSVGSSGDLAPLSHLALVLLGFGEAEYKGEIISGAEAMKRAGLKPVRLAAKEGLALNNGTQVMTAIACLSLLRAEILCQTADITAAMTVDALLGTPTAFDELIHSVRPHPGQKESAQNLRNLLKNSSLRDSHLNCSNVQDAYSLRCTPQVHGATRQNLRHIRNVLEIEINSATDNPLIFPDQDKVLSGGNFHGEPIAFVSDLLGICVSELANISERRIEQLYNPALNRGLSPFLASRPGIDSGLMIAQFTASSLVSENKVLSHPSSVDSIPTSANQEDHVSMGTIGAVKARNIIENTAYVLGIELMSACQAIEMRQNSIAGNPSIESSQALMAVLKDFRNKVKTLEKDRIMYDDIKIAKKFVESRFVIDKVRYFIELV